MGKKKIPMVIDAGGNMVQKGSKTDPDMITQRAAASARRAAKAAATVAPAAEESEPAAIVTTPDGVTLLATPIKIGDNKEDEEATVGTGTEKTKKPKKERGLTRRQKKQLEKEAKDAVEAAERATELEDPLSQFILSFAGSVGGGEDGGARLSRDDVVVEGFSISAPGHRSLLTDATLKLFKGRRYGLMGSNGSGKSTLLRFLAAKPCRLPVPEDLDILLVEQEISASEVSVLEQVLKADTARTALLNEEKILWAAISKSKDGEDADAPAAIDAADATLDWTDADWTENLRRLAEVGKELVASGADAAEAKVCRILSGLGFTASMQAGGTTTLSGGWRMRVSLARALFREPALLLLDEPTNHLDLNAVLWLEDHLSKKFKGTVLTVSHDADFLNTVCTDVIDLNTQSLDYHPRDVYKFLAGREGREKKRRSDYTLQEKTMKLHLGQGMSKKVAEKKTLGLIKRSAFVDKPKEYKVNFTFKNPDDDRPTIAVLGVGFAYKGAGTTAMFDSMHFCVGTHSRLAVVGPNGAGKTTLLQLLTGKRTPTSGEVSLHRKLKIGSFDQHFEELLPVDKTPVTFLTSEYGLNDHEARKALGQFGLDGPLHLIQIADLSGGQKARVVFASLSLLRPQVLILDEPTNHLDMESVEALVEGIKAFEGGVVMVSHDARLIMDTESDVWVCEGADNVTAGGTGLRIEERGFEKYRSDLLIEVEKQAAAEETRALQRAVTARKKAELRMKTLERLRAGGGK